MKGDYEQGNTKRHKQRELENKQPKTKTQKEIKIMQYKSKKTGELAHFDSKDEKYGTTTLVYDSGDKKGTAFQVTGSTLKRWWKKVDDSNEQESADEEPKSVSDIDAERINEPYPEPKEQKYIPKPKAVKELEARKKRVRGKYNDTLPDYETATNQLGKVLKKINKGYAVFKNGSSLHRLNPAIIIYAEDQYREILEGLGLEVGDNSQDSARPYKFAIKDVDTWNSFVEQALAEADNEDDDEAPESDTIEAPDNDTTDEMED